MVDDPPIRTAAWWRERLIPDATYRLLVTRPGDRDVAAAGTGRLLWSTVTAGCVWWVSTTMHVPAATLLACLVAVAIALGGLSGLAAGALAPALAMPDVDLRARMAVVVVVVVVGAATARPAAWAGRRCGALPIGAVCVATALGVLAAGPAGGFFAPACVAAVRGLVRA